MPPAPLGLPICHRVNKCLAAYVILKWVYAFLFTHDNKNVASRYVPGEFGFGLIKCVSQNTPEMAMPAAVTEHHST